ncbi:glutathione peroxidase [Vulgatibacter sp.]|uniref:glutathione peroxidase n=1 Tax=Vulgatibacter sp. TaxID=1971226 RepID=UPI003569311E
MSTSSPLYEIPLRRIDGTPTTLADFEGKVLLVVNVASECGLTPQYEALEKLYEAHRERGLEVLGFPANEFGAQEPGSNEQIQSFCQSNYGVQFPMFEKIVVKGAGIHPLYQQLVAAWPSAENFGDDGFARKLAGYGIQHESPSDVLWNFEKFLVDRSGKVVGRFSPEIKPDDPRLVQAIEAALAAR